MDIVPYLAALAGFFVCMLVWSRGAHWIHSVWLVARERRRAPAQRSVFRVVAAVLLSSGPWMLIGFTVFTVYILSTPHAPGWNWFFGGAFVSLLVVAFSVFLVLKRQRIARRARVP